MSCAAEPAQRTSALPYPDGFGACERPGMSAVIGLDSLVARESPVSLGLRGVVVMFFARANASAKGVGRPPRHGAASPASRQRPVLSRR